MAIPVRYHLRFQAGGILPSNVLTDKIGSRPVLGGEFATDFLVANRYESFRRWNNASVGVAISYLNLTNNQILGNAFAAYTYLNVPLVRTPHFVFGLRPGIGLAFVDKTYFNTCPSDLLYSSGSIRLPSVNGAVGSHTNAYFAEALYFSFPINAEWELSLTAGWYHLSNGSTRQPNSGYNMLSGSLSVSYSPSASDEKQSSRVVCSSDAFLAQASKGDTAVSSAHVVKSPFKKYDIDFSLTGGFRQAYYRDRHTFGVSALHISAHYRPVYFFQIGAGVDFFYDDYYRSTQAVPSESDVPHTFFQKTYLATSKLSNCFRLGVSVQPEFVIGHMSIGLALGVYLIDPVRNLEPYSAVEANGGEPLHRGVFYKYDLTKAGVEQDGWLYTQVHLKYHVTQHLFVHAEIKSHLAKAEYFALGLGFGL